MAWCIAVRHGSESANTTAPQQVEWDKTQGLSNAMRFRSVSLRVLVEMKLTRNPD